MEPAIETSYAAANRYPPMAERTPNSAASSSIHFSRRVRRYAVAAGATSMATTRMAPTLSNAPTVVSDTSPMSP